MAQFFWQATAPNGEKHAGIAADREAIDRLNDAGWAGLDWREFTAQTLDSMSSAERVRMWCAMGWQYSIEPAGVQGGLFGKDEPMVLVQYGNTRIMISEVDLEGVKAHYQGVLRF
jgi:hypothetical protein